MFAVIKTGGKQFRVAAQDVVTIPKLDLEPGAAVTFDNVLTLSHEGGVEVGAPGVAGAVISAEVVEQTRGPKVIAFKKRRRQNSRRKRGHRQDFTVVRINGFTLNGKALGAAEAAAGRRKAKPAAAQTTDAEPALAESVTVE
jgi:large subunit ribosomal protein L21